jgi:Contractile injection system tape measure protein
MAGMVITVRRQVLDVEFCGAESDGMVLQHRLPALCANVVSPALEAALADFEPGETHLHIARIDVDLASIPLDRLDAELAEAVRREMALYFSRHCTSGHDDAGPPAADGVVRRRTPGDTSSDALLVFLQTGRLPWFCHVPPGTSFERLVLDTWAAEGWTGPPAAIAARLLVALALPAVRTRLVTQFSPQFAVAVLHAVSPTVAFASGEVMSVLDPASLPVTVRRAYAHRVWDAALLAAAARERPSSEELARAAWAAAGQTEHADRKLAALLERTWTGVTKPGTGPPPAQTRPQPREPITPLDVEDPAGGILVEHAGLVILHPFLMQFFAGLGVVTGDQLVDPKRALCLLHHLATGEMVAPEYRLTMAKVLCAVPLEQPVPADVGLSAAEVDEASALLEAAIAHWGALGAASPDALRGEFLLRTGTLMIDDDGDWLLRVEQRTVDILLDRLPWGTSLIKLPWMPRLLKVEWR